MKSLHKIFHRFPLTFFIVIFVLLGGLFLSRTFVHADNPTNLINNPSLENADPNDSSLPLDWLKGNWGTNTTTFTYPVAGEDGANAAEVSMSSYTSGDAKFYFVPVSIQSGSSYIFSDYYQSSIPTDIMAQFDDGTGNLTYQDLGTEPTSPTWTNASISFIAPVNAKNVTIFHLITGVGSLTIDNVSLILNPAPNAVIASPASGSTVTGATEITVNAMDNTGVASVQLQIDGATIGSPITSAPYQLSWDSSTVSNGTHKISAVVTNVNHISETSPAISVLVTNSNPGGSNLVPNPSLENADPNDSSLPLDWLKGNWGTNTTTFTYPVAGEDGANAAEVSMSSYTSGDAKFYFVPQVFVPDTQYQFSDYYESTVATQVDVAFGMSDGSTLYQLIGLPENANTWTKFMTEFSVPLGAQTVTIYHLLNNAGSLSVDNYNIKPYTPTGFTRPLVTLTFDDGYDNDYTQGLPLLEKYGFDSTQFIITDLVGQAGYVTSDQVKAFSDAGNEIASHTVTHDDLLLETPDQVDSEFKDSQSQLATWTGVPVTDLAFPEGLYNSAIVADAQKYYRGSRGIEDALNSADNFNQYDIRDQNIYTTTTLEQVKDWVAQAQATNTWLVLTYHSVDPSNLGDSIYNVTPDQLDAELAAINTSGVKVVTIQQALTELLPPTSSVRNPSVTGNTNTDGSSGGGSPSSTSTGSSADVVTFVPHGGGYAFYSNILATTPNTTSGISGSQTALLALNAIPGITSIIPNQNQNSNQITVNTTTPDTTAGVDTSNPISVTNTPSPDNTQVANVINSGATKQDLLVLAFVLLMIASGIYVKIYFYGSKQ